MEGTTTLKDKLEKQLNEFEDWYKAVIFNKDGTIIASKNANKASDKEIA
jgi:predicted DNA-binding protein